MKLSLFPAALTALAVSAEHAISTVIHDTLDGGHRLVISFEGDAVTALHLGEGELKSLWQEIGAKLGLVKTEAEDAVDDVKADAESAETVVKDVASAALGTVGSTITDVENATKDLGAAASSAEAAAAEVTGAAATVEGAAAAAVTGEAKPQTQTPPQTA